MTDQKVDMGNEINNEVPDIYHDPDNMILLARIADGLSWLFLVLFVVVIGIIGYMAYYSYVNHLAKEQYIFYLPTFLVPLLIAGFGWIVLKILSEGVYVVMDIEDNTRRSKSPAKE